MLEKTVNLIKVNRNRKGRFIMNKKAFLSLVVGALVMFSQSSHAADCSNDHTGAVIAGSVAGGASAVGLGATATTMSGAVIMSTLATAGAGSAAVGIGVIAAVPLAIGASVYGLWYWLSGDDED